MLTYEEYLLENPEATQEEYDLYVIAETERLAEEDRKEEFRDRIKAIKELRMCAEYVGISQPNLSLLVIDIVDNNRLDDLVALEAASLIIDAELATKELKETERLQVGKDIKNNKDKIKTMKLQELADLVFKIVEYLKL